MLFFLHDSSGIRQYKTPLPRRGLRRFRHNPHEICTFCTSPQKNRIFPFIFAVSHLRSLPAFAIVASGPSFPLENSDFSLVAGLDSFEAEK